MRNNRLDDYQQPMPARRPPDTARPPAQAPVSTPPAPPAAPPRRSKLKYFIIAGITLLVLALIGFLVYGYFDAKQDIKRLSNPTEANKQERDNLVDKVSRLIDVPQNEEPQVATVKDVNKLRAQPFFKDAQNGDKVLFYVNAKRAILYRPSTDKVILSAPVNFGNTSQSQNGLPASQ